MPTEVLDIEGVCPSMDKELTRMREREKVRRKLWEHVQKNRDVIKNLEKEI